MINSYIWYLVLAGVVIFFLLNQLNIKKRYRVQDLFTEQYKEENLRKKSLRENPFKRFENSKLLKLIGSENVVKEAQKYNWNITAKEYWLYVIVSGAGISIVISIFQLGFLSTLGFIGGFVLPRVMLALQRLRYRKETEDKLIIYMKAVSNAMPVYGNVVDAVDSILPLIGEPIKKDIEIALAVLRTGTTVDLAFQHMNEKYGYNDLLFFHNMLGAAHENGGEFHRILITTADEFEQKKVLQAKLRSNMAQSNKAFQQSVIFVLGMLVVFKFFAKDIYDKFFTTPAGKGVIIFIVISIVFSATRVYKHNQFDPSEANTK
ncbi:MAG: hypothetical protein Q8934_22330 [Bacillota bacterium]|nr:hypothetical protein [Bacillota bacterium]